MPRRNGNVRQRNLPRAAQRQPRTPGAQLRARDHRPYSRQPSAVDRADIEFALYSKLDSQPPDKPELHL